MKCVQSYVIGLVTHSRQGHLLRTSRSIVLDELRATLGAQRRRRELHRDGAALVRPQARATIVCLAITRSRTNSRNRERALSSVRKLYVHARAGGSHLLIAEVERGRR